MLLKHSLFAVFSALDSAEVPYLVVGGIAVVAHGVARLTDDVDLVLPLDRESVLAAWRALESLGYKPQQPITAEQFADPETRQRFVREKKMFALCMLPPSPEFPVVDVFAEAPFPFEEERAECVWFSVGADLRLPVVRLECLLEMKRSAGRAKDLLDIDNLRRLRAERSAQA